MAAAIESPISYPESPMEESDAIYPCKGCGEILEEGKAFELAGNRWHIDCFRCNTCGTLLDSDANLLLLGDGSLICNNCTYSCNACGNKIEDLAILTGDQAFCAACFRCRNCKRKIENLRYARTSQGIFCMRCHESLMERRRKKAKAQKSALATTPSNGPVVLDKSLPALPPNANPPATFDLKDGLTDNQDRSRRGSSNSRYNSHADPARRDSSPTTDDAHKDTLTLPASTYGQERLSNVPSLAPSELDDDQRGYLPMAFDPTPPALTTRSPRRSDHGESHIREVSNHRDYFNARGSSKANHRDYLREAPSRSNSSEREAAHKSGSPHLSVQDKQRRETRRKETPEVSSKKASPQGSGSDTTHRPQLQHADSSGYGLGLGEGFRLQDAPRTRKGSLRSDDQDPQPSSFLDNALRDPSTPHIHSRNVSTTSPNVKDVATPDSGINPFDDPKLRDPNLRHPARGDSLNTSGRKPVPTTSGPDRSGSELAPTSGAMLQDHLRSGSTVSTSSGYLDLPGVPPRGDSRGLDSPLSRGMDIPPRAAGRASAPSKSVANDDFIAPRAAPPAPPSIGHDRRNESISSMHSPETSSPMRGHFHKPSLGADFSLEEEMSRIIGGRKDSSPGDSSPSVLRRVSNAVRHGRSFSDRAVPMAQRTPTSAQMDISSPLNPSHPLSPVLRGDDVSSLKAHLKRAQQRIAELESEKIGLQEKMANSGDLRQVNTELREKRSTMAFLDTQREMVVRELEVMTEHLSRAKDTNQPLDLAALQTDVMQDFAHSLQRLKDNLGSQIEDLVHKRNELTDDISNLIQVKDKGLQEFESLSSKNNQLNELNAQLVHNIQDMYKANRLPNGGSMMDLRSGSLQDTISLTSLPQDSPDLEQAQLINAPQVVNIRKGGQAKKFSWKKGGRDVAKKMTGGIKGAFVKDGQYDLNGMPLNPSPVLTIPTNDSGSLKAQSVDSDRSRLPFFSGQKNGGRTGQSGNTPKSNSSNNLLGHDPSGMRRSMHIIPPYANAPSALFGSDLAQRCDFEKRVLPSIVNRCIDEIEARGMDAEGIYRKSGGSGQVKQIQAGFERDGNFDISDPDLDIHAVTSCLKQYFRKLPNPLITYDVYESVLEAAQLPEVEKRGMAMKIALGNLPPSHKDVLEYLIGHLTRVVELENVNLMSVTNLSVVFAPTIMRPSSIEREMTDMQAQREVVRTMLDNHIMIFE
ncbi:RhoGAP-domain-containing protein [Myriangium duriaei CBS 260.36]|uniref:RhoGAP-domain-containing protein n=1 Tax=Myriangium duriaei CBS 260.36 TaxID=1168546 RepID=A0A9P4J514_9PEZI|nr:RhoGAP-domain-containing protein [Myriangium duriaei CBS 260.36]